MIEKLFINKKMIELLEFLVLHDGWEQNYNEVCGIIKIRPSRMKRLFHLLERYEIINVTKIVTDNIFFKVNCENPIITPLRVLMTQIGTLYMQKYY